MNPSPSLDRSTQIGDIANVAASALDHAGDQASHLATNFAKRGADALRDGSHQLQDKAMQLQDKAQRVTDSTVTYIKEEPVMSRFGHRN
jgi:X-X-X-Leu-X-X-Gly heptad repeat protein